MFNNMEILSPAGSLEALKAAVLSGADAIYFGASSFNAREGAANFSENEITEGIKFCKARGVKTHATLNILTSDREFFAALKVAEIFVNAGIDAFIVQDIGLAGILKRATDVPLHASTQITIHNLDGVLQALQLGFTRVVLSRECSKNEIKHIISHSAAEIEIFAHGALCMSYSGQCYMSSIIGGRSGNRGRCAQPCRLPYKNGYALSLKDLCLLEYVRELQEIGVTSLKIEGRMKSPEYVAAITAAYAAAKRGEEYTPEKKAFLAGIFSRGGFTEGYYIDKTGKDMFGTKSQTTEKYNLPTKEYKRIGLDVNFKHDNNYNLSCSVGTEDGLFAQAELKGQPANKLPTSKEALQLAFNKFGDTPYYINSFKADLPDDIFIPSSLINDTRRKITDNLTSIRQINIHGFKNINIEKNNFPSPEKHLEGYFIKLTTIPENAGSLDFLWLPITDIESPEFILCFEKYENKIGLYLPRIIHDSEKNQIEKFLNEAKKLGIKDILCGNIGHIKLCFDHNFTPHGDFGLNIYNSQSRDIFFSLGLSTLTLSFELNFAQLRDITVKNTGIIAYGRLPFMIFKNCLKDKKNIDFLTDRIGKKFLLTCDFSCRNILWNSDILYLADKPLENLGFLRLIFTDEKKEDIQKIINDYLFGGEAFDSITRGRYL